MQRNSMTRASSFPSVAIANSSERCRLSGWLAPRQRLKRRALLTSRRIGSRGASKTHSLTRIRVGAGAHVLTFDPLLFTQTRCLRPSPLPLLSCRSRHADRAAVLSPLSDLPRDSARRSVRVQSRGVHQTVRTMAVPRTGCRGGKREETGGGGERTQTEGILWIQLGSTGD